MTQQEKVVCTTPQICGSLTHVRGSAKHQACPGLNGVNKTARKLPVDPETSKVNVKPPRKGVVRGRHVSDYPILPDTHDAHQRAIEYLAEDEGISYQDAITRILEDKDRRKFLEDRAMEDLMADYKTQLAAAGGLRLSTAPNKTHPRVNFDPQQWEPPFPLKQELPYGGTYNREDFAKVEGEIESTAYHPKSTIYSMAERIHETSDSAATPISELSPEDRADLIGRARRDALEMDKTLAYYDSELASLHNEVERERQSMGGSSPKAPEGEYTQPIETESPRDKPAPEEEDSDTLSIDQAIQEIQRLREENERLIQETLEITRQMVEASKERKRQAESKRDEGASSASERPSTTSRFEEVQVGGRGRFAPQQATQRPRSRVGRMFSAFASTWRAFWRTFS